MPGELGRRRVRKLDGVLDEGQPPGFFEGVITHLALPEEQRDVGREFRGVVPSPLTPSARCVL